MALINMKSKPEREEMPGEIERDEPRYPYGLCISLGKDEGRAEALYGAPV